jgi:predicted ATPase with chaperone activity
MSSTPVDLKSVTSAIRIPSPQGQSFSGMNGSLGGAQPPEEPARPAVPQSLEDAGLPHSIIEQLILKHLYFRGELSGRDLANVLGLRFSLIDDLLEMMKRQHQVGVKRSAGLGNNSSVFALTEAGRTLTREYIDQNGYVGPAPVPLAQYSKLVVKQRHRAMWLTPELLQKAFRHLVVTPHLVSQIGPAVNSGKSFLIYGQPGNGKTAIAEALFRIEDEPIFIPYALEYHGNIVQMYDPIYHQRIDDEESELSALTPERTYDGRWFRSRRPFIITGGELTLEMLDLSYNESSKTYDAPFQLKANNGIYLIDDFGRQKASPAEILNRWIVPMERHIDYLTFRSGGKMTVPFEAFLIFSTNLNPSKLGDEAFLRRIQYKMLLRSPCEQEFRAIFQRYAESRQIAIDVGTLDRFIARNYKGAHQRAFRRCHPRDVISHALDIIQFERRPPILDEDVLNRAFHSCFVEEQHDE